VAEQFQGGRLGSAGDLGGTAARQYRAHGPQIIETASHFSGALENGGWGEANGKPFDMALFERRERHLDHRAPLQRRGPAPPARARPGILFKGTHLASILRAETRDHDLPDEIRRSGRRAGLRSRRVCRRRGRSRPKNTQRKNKPSAISDLAGRGIRGFPTLLAGSARDGYALVPHGYRPLEAARRSLEAWARRRRAR